MSSSWKLWQLCRQSQRMTDGVAGFADLCGEVKRLRVKAGTAHDTVGFGPFSHLAATLFLLQKLLSATKTLRKALTQTLAFPCAAREEVTRSFGRVRARRHAVLRAGWVGSAVTKCRSQAHHHPSGVSLINSARVASLVGSMERSSRRP